jgi:hypothetical protein
VLAKVRTTSMLPHQVNAERSGDAERNGDMNAGKHKPEQYDDDCDHVEMAEHDALPSNVMGRRGGHHALRAAGDE